MKSKIFLPVILLSSIVSSSLFADFYQEVYEAFYNLNDHVYFHSEMSEQDLLDAKEAKAKCLQEVKEVLKKFPKRKYAFLTDNQAEKIWRQAAFHGDKEALDLLKSRGVQVQPGHISPLIVSMWYSNAKSMNFFLDNGVKPEGKGKLKGGIEPSLKYPLGEKRRLLYHDRLLASIVGGQEGDYEEVANKLKELNLFTEEWCFFKETVSK